MTCWSIRTVCGPVAHRSFKAGSTIPLKWQYTRDESLFDSGLATPVVNVYGPVACGTVTAGDTVAVNDAGSSGLRYDSASKTWQFQLEDFEFAEGLLLPSRSRTRTLGRYREAGPPQDRQVGAWGARGERAAAYRYGLMG
jgi:hypothetical protein